MGENVKHPDSLTQLVAVFVGKTTLENGLAMPTEDEHLSIYLSLFHDPAFHSWVSSKRNES